MRVAVLVVAGCAALASAFSPALPTARLHSSNSAVACSAQRGVESRRSFLALAAGLALVPKNAFAKAPPAEVEDLDEVDEEEDAEVQAKAKKAFKKQLADEEKAAGRERALSAQALRPVDQDKPSKKSETGGMDWKAGIMKSLDQGKEIKKMRKNRDEMCEVLGRGC